MSISFKDNFNSINYFPNIYVDFDKRNSYAKKEKDIVGNTLEINLRNYQAKSLNNTFFSFFRDDEKRDSKNADDLIISIKKSKNEKDEDIYLAQTGNYVGKFKWHRN